MPYVHMCVCVPQDALCHVSCVLPRAMPCVMPRVKYDWKMIFSRRLKHRPGCAGNCPSVPKINSQMCSLYCCARLQHKQRQSAGGIGAFALPLREASRVASRPEAHARATLDHAGGFPATDPGGVLGLWARCSTLVVTHELISQTSAMFFAARERQARTAPKVAAARSHGGPRRHLGGRMPGGPNAGRTNGRFGQQRAPGPSGGDRATGRGETIAPS